MTKELLKNMFSTRFEGGCAKQWGEIIIEQGAITETMDIALGNGHPLPFRAAYALEHAFFSDPEYFAPFYSRFAADYCRVSSESVMRHYGKIVAWLLKKGKLKLTHKEAEELAEAACRRVVDEKLKVAARAWPLEILVELRNKVEWMDEVMPSVIESIGINPSPAMIVRLRRFKRSYK